MLATWVCLQVHADMDVCIRACMSATGVVHMHSLAYRGLTHVVRTWLQKHIFACMALVATFCCMDLCCIAWVALVAMAGHWCSFAAWLCGVMECTPLGRCWFEPSHSRNLLRIWSTASHLHEDLRLHHLLLLAPTMRCSIVCLWLH